MNVLVGKETQVNSAIAELSLVFLLHFKNCTYIYTFLVIGKLAASLWPFNVKCN